MLHTLNDRIRLWLLCDDPGTQQQIEQSCGTECVLHTSSLQNAGQAALENTERFQSFAEYARSADAILILWNLLQAPLIGSLCYRFRNPVAPLLALCGMQEEDQVAALVVGADECLPRSPSLHLLKAKIVAHRRLSKRLLAEDKVLYRSEVDPSSQTFEPETQAPLQVGKLMINMTAFTLTIDGEEVILTPRQLALLSYLVEHPNTLLSRDDILEAVWGIDFETGTNMVDVYIHYLRRILRERGLADSIQTVRGYGYRFVLQAA